MSNIQPNFITFPIYGNIQEDEPFYVASLQYPFNRASDNLKNLKYPIAPRLYWISEVAIDSKLYYNTAYSSAPTSCQLLFNTRPDIEGFTNTPPFKSQDFIFTEFNSKSPLSIFKSNTRFSKNMTWFYGFKSGDTVGYNKIESASSSKYTFRENNFPVTDLFSKSKLYYTKNSIYKYNYFNPNNLQQTDLFCERLQKLMTFPKNKDYYDIQGLIYTGLPMTLWSSIKTANTEQYRIEPVHNKYVVSCFDSNGCTELRKISRPDFLPETNLRACYDFEKTNATDWNFCLDDNSSYVLYNDINYYVNQNFPINNTNTDFLNYYYVPQTVYFMDESNVLKERAGVEVMNEFYNYTFYGRAATLRNYYTKSLIKNQKVPTQQFVFTYCTNSQYNVPTINGYGCNSCFSIARAYQSMDECQCEYNFEKTSTDNQNLTFLKSDLCDKYQSCYCDFPDLYKNKNNTITCNSCNCVCDSENPQNICPVEKCSYYQKSETNETNTFLIIILSASAVIILIIVIVLITTSLKKKQIVYTKQDINIEFTKTK